MKRSLIFLIFSAAAYGQPTPPANGSLTVNTTTGAIVAPVNASTFKSANSIATSPVSNASLANSTITIAGTSTALGGSITLDTITGLSSTGIVKRTASNTLAIATSGTDYAPATSGSSLLYGNGSGGFSNATVITASGLSFSSGNISLSSVPNSSLSNATISIAGTSTALGGSITLDTIDNGLAANGLIARTAANTRAARSIIQGTGISVTNPDGVAGNITIAASAVPNSALANSTVTVGSTSIALGGSSTSLAGLNSITAASATALTLSGGATSGNVVVNTNSSTLAATFAGANTTLAGNLTVNGSTGTTYTVANAGVTFQGAGSIFGNSGDIIAKMVSGQGFYVKDSTNGAILSILNTGGATFAGNLTVSGTATATNTSSGALVVGSNVGLSGNAGGAIFFGGNLTASGASDRSASVTTTGTANAAKLILTSGDGTTSGRFAYTQLVSSETSGQTWNVGMYGGKPFTIRDGSTAFVTIADSTGAATLAGNLTVSGTGTSSFAGPVKLPAYAVASLPSAASNTGALAYVTDANATTRLSTVAGGGSNKVIVFSDGTNWLIL